MSNIEKADSKEKNSSLINIKGSDGNFIEASENEKKLNDKISYINKQTEDVNVLNINTLLSILFKFFVIFLLLVIK